MGNSGSGKSLFTKKLFYQLLQDFNEEDSIKHPLPLYFNLNQFKNYNNEYANRESLIKKIKQLICFKLFNSKIHFMVFLDGYDEYVNRDYYFFKSLKLFEGDNFDILFF